LPLGAILCALLWGSAFPAIKLTYERLGDVGLKHYIAFAGMRFILAGLMVLFFIKNKKQSWLKSPKFSLLQVALFQVVLQYIFFYIGLEMTSGVLCAILVATGSFWWMLLAPWVDKKTVVLPFQWFILLLGFAGVVVCVMRNDGASSEPLLGGACIMFATLCGVFASLKVKPLNETLSVPFISGVSLFVGGVALSVMVPNEFLYLIQNMDAWLMSMTIYLALVSALAFSLWYWLITKFEVVKLSVYRMLIPICGAFESLLFLDNEVIDLQLITGALMVLSSIFILEKYKKA